MTEQTIRSSGYHVVLLGGGWSMAQRLESECWQFWGKSYPTMHEAIAAWSPIQEKVSK
jgi:hypothetical protein